jgi:hypothetical protein
MRQVIITAILATLLGPTAASAQSTTEARAIAKEATIYGFPLVDSYRIQYSYFADRTSPEFKAGDVPGSVEFLKRSALPTLSR